MYSDSRTLIYKNMNIAFLEEDRDELDNLLSNLSTSQSSAEEESQKEILTIINRRARAQSSNTLGIYNIKAPIPLKKSSSFVIERIPRPCNL
jgi:hypothetical protein